MSKTPETDAARLSIEERCRFARAEGVLYELVPADFARSLESRLAEANERADRLQKSARFLSKELCDFEATGVSYPARLDAAWRRLTVDIEAIDAARGKK